VYLQYFRWLAGIAQGDLGRSVRTDGPVLPIITDRLPATIELVIVSLLIGVIISVPVGVLSAVRHRSWLDYTIGVFTASGVAVPSFWLGILLITAFAVQLRWLPASGYTPLMDDPLANLREVLLPAVTLGLYIAAYIARFLRTDMLEVLGQDYVRTARAKGLPPAAVLVRHALRNALASSITILGILVGSLLGGVVIIEQVFGWSGIGWLSIQAVFNRDYPVVQGVVLLGAATFLIVNLLVDLSYALLDPRARTSSG
jgi:peptide/nickel transport system permease protein